jgi:hypothetical protein
VGERVDPYFAELQTVIIYMYGFACLLTTYRRYWSNVSRRYGQSGARGQYPGEGTLSGPVARQRSLNLTYSTSVLAQRGQDFETFNATRPLFTC